MYQGQLGKACRRPYSVAPKLRSLQHVFTGIELGGVGAGTPPNSVSNESLVSPYVSLLLPPNPNLFHLEPGSSSTEQLFHQIGEAPS